MAQLTIDQALQQAIEAHISGQAETADRLYTAILEAYPGHPDANHNIGVLAVSYGKLPEAIPFLEAAIHSNPNISQYWVTYISTLLQLEQLEDAKFILDQAKRNGAEGDAFEKLEQRVLQAENEKFVPSRNIGPKSVLEQTDSSAALLEHKLGGDKLSALIDGRVSKTSLAIDPPKNQLQSLVDIYNKGQFVKALEQVSTLTSQFPRSPILLNIKGSVLNSLQQSELSIEAYREALAIWPDYNEALYNMACVLQQQGKFEEAIKAYSSVLVREPKNAYAHYNLGIIFQAQGKWEEAISAYQRSIIIRPDYADAYYNLGLVLQEKGELQAAIDAYTNTIAIKPDYVSAHNCVGVCFYNLGQLENAIKAYKKAVNIDSNFVHAYNNLGNALKHQGRLGEALDAYNKVLAKNPAYAADAHNNIGVTLQEQGKLNEAIRSFNRALDLRPNSCIQYFNLGNALKVQGKLDKALENYNKALAINSDYAECYNNMGVSLGLLGKVEESITAYANALKIKPKQKEFWNNLAIALKINKSKILFGKNGASYIPDIPNLQSLQPSLAVLNYVLNEGSENAKYHYQNSLSELKKADKPILRRPELNNRRQIPQPKVSDNVIALFHWGRSGSGLLHSLIDAHPEVSTLPSIYLSQYFDPDTWTKLTSDGWHNLVDNFILLYDVLFDATSPVGVQTKSNKYIDYIGVKEGMANVGDQRNEALSVNRSMFREELNRMINCFDQLDAFLFFKLVHKAYDNAIKDTNIKKTIFYHIHNPDIYAQLNFVRLAPKVKCIMMVREPIQCCESWILSSVKNNDDYELASMISSMLFQIDNIIFDRGRTVGVRLEDLKERPRKTLITLANWMGIEENESLYKMTAQGKKWWGDPSSPDFDRDGMLPFGRASIDRKVGSIFSERDQFILETLFYPFSMRFGYTEENEPQFKTNLQLIRPMLDNMFDFERKLAKKNHLEMNKFSKSGPFLFLRSALVERWETLKKHGTYPNMIQRLGLK